MTTYCADCDHVHSDTRNKEPWKWVCLKAPTTPGYGFVSPDYSPSPPYRPCRFVNQAGECPMFAPVRKPPEEIAA